MGLGPPQFRQGGVRLFLGAAQLVLAAVDFGGEVVDGAGHVTQLVAPIQVAHLPIARVVGQSPGGVLKPAQGPRNAAGHQKRRPGGKQQADGRADEQGGAQQAGASHRAVLEQVVQVAGGVHHRGGVHVHRGDGAVLAGEPVGGALQPVAPGGDGGQHLVLDQRGDGESDHPVAQPPAVGRDIAQPARIAPLQCPQGPSAQRQGRHGDGLGFLLHGVGRNGAAQKFRHLGLDGTMAGAGDVQHPLGDGVITWRQLRQRPPVQTLGAQPRQFGKGRPIDVVGSGGHAVPPRPLACPGKRRGKTVRDALHPVQRRCQAIKPRLRFGRRIRIGDGRRILCGQPCAQHRFPQVVQAVHHGTAGQQLPVDLGQGGDERGVGGVLPLARLFGQGEQPSFLFRHAAGAGVAEGDGVHQLLQPGGVAVRGAAGGVDRVGLGTPVRQPAQSLQRFPGAVSGAAEGDLMGQAAFGSGVDEVVAGPRWRRSSHDRRCRPGPRLRASGRSAPAKSRRTPRSAPR